MLKKKKKILPTWCTLLPYFVISANVRGSSFNLGFVRFVAVMFAERARQLQEKAEANII